MSTVSKDTNYAITCIINRTTNRRSFDNCFENGEERADQIVKNIMFKALNPPTKVIMEIGKSYFLDSAEYKAIKKYQRWERLVLGLKEGGFWNSWLHFYNHGTLQA